MEITSDRLSIVGMQNILSLGVRVPADSQTGHSLVPRLKAMAVVIGARVSFAHGCNGACERIQLEICE